MLLDNIWYGKHHPVSLLLTPLSWLFCTGTRIRRLAYRRGWLTQYKMSVPIIIVGNITVGGTGKTPLVIWLSHFLKQQGYFPGIVSRGYGGQATHWPQYVTSNSDPQVVGDEALLLARRTGCPVTVAPQRVAAVEALLSQHPCNVIISDDGLQHYHLQRDIEIAVLDDIRRYGNRRCLPAGPLREPLPRLSDIDFFVTKGAVLRDHFSVQEFPMHYDIKPLCHVKGQKSERLLSVFRGRSVHALAGIGHPERFFTRLRDNGLKLSCHSFPDHHFYKQEDIHFDDGLPVIMTEKDAVKCQTIAGIEHWYLPIEARLPTLFGERLLQKIRRIQQNG